MRPIHLVTFIFLLLSQQALPQDTTKVLKATSIIPASAAEQNEADEKTKFLIEHVSQARPLFEKFILIGPRLWDKIKNEAQFKSWADESDLTFKVPSFNEAGEYVSKVDMKGKVIQDEYNYLKLWTHISEKFDLANMQVAEKNNRDKFILWQYFAKIEEPVNAIQATNARLLLKFIDGKLYFIEWSGK